MPTGVDSGLATGGLAVVLDLGETPTLENVTQQLVSVRELWLYAATCQWLAARQALGHLRFGTLHHVHTFPPDPATDPETVDWFNRLTGPARQEFAAARADVQGEAHLVVRRMRLASPLEIVLGAVQDVGQIGATTAAGLVALRTLLKMVMSWQVHRLNIRRGEEELAHLKQTRAEADIKLAERAETWLLMNTFSRSFEAPEEEPGRLVPYTAVAEYLRAAERGETHPCAPADEAIQDLGTIGDVGFEEQRD